ATRNGSPDAPMKVRNAPVDSSPMRPLISGRHDGASAPGRGSPGGGANASRTDAPATTRNARRHDEAAATPPRSGANECPAAWQLKKIPTARLSRWAGTAVPSPARSSGEVKALAAPMTVRAVRNHARVGATAQVSEETTNAT